MPIVDYSSYKNKLSNFYQEIMVVKQASSTLAGPGLLVSQWLFPGYTGATPVAPTSPVILDRTSPGGLGQFNSSTVQRILEISMSIGNQSSGSIIIADRLSHQGGLSGNTNSVQTTNLPTAALTRYTSGSGVFVGLEIYSVIGSTLTTFTMSYTNQSGVSGRTTELSSIGSADYRQSGRFLVPGLQQGDTGVLSVESVTLANATGIAGNLGVVLFKPLMIVPVTRINVDYNGLIGLCGQIPKVENDAHIFLIYVPSNSLVVSNNLSTKIKMAEE